MAPSFEPGGGPSSRVCGPDGVHRPAPPSTRRHLLLAAGALAFAGPVRAAEAAGAVEEIRGDAFATDRSAQRRLEPAGPVYVDETVATGAESRLAIRLGRDTRLRLGAGARARIDRYIVGAGGEIVLDGGALLFDRAGGPPERTRIRSPFGLIAVRGTRFFAGPSNGVFGVFVAHGRVEVSAAGRRVALRAGEGTDIAHPGAPPTAPRAWGEGRIRAALASVA